VTSNSTDKTLDVVVVVALKKEDRYREEQSQGKGE
jgi:hypothetical protein